MIAESPSQPTIERTTFYILPKFLSQIQHITTIDSGGQQFVICCDKMKLYIFPLIAGINKPLGNIHQSLPIPNIKSLRTIAKNYLMIETQNKYIGIFQIIKSTARQPTQKPMSPYPNAVKVQFSEVLKWRLFSSYFIRQVMENLFEVQVFFTDVEFQIFQFTIKNKRGSMSFTIGANGKIQKCNKKQLYGSKCFFNIGRKLMYWLKNFSDKQFVIQQLSIQPPLGPLAGNKLLNEPFAYFGVQRSEQYKQIYPNLMIRDCINPSKRFGLKIDKDSFLNELKSEIAQLTPSKRKIAGQENPFNELVEQSTCMENITQILQNIKITTFTDMLMVENKSKKQVEIYQIKGDGAQLIGKESSQILLPTESKDKKSINQSGQSAMLELRRWQWHFGNSKKLIGIDKLGFQLKYIQQICLQTKQQKIIQAQLVNMNQKIQQLKPQTQLEKPNPNNDIQNHPSKQKQPQTVEQIKNQPKEEESAPKRKFSKDQFEKFVGEFTKEDAQNYVDKQLINKVDQVNNSAKKQVPLNQKSSDHIKTNSFKFKNSPESLETKKQTSPKTIEPKNQNSPKQQKSTIQVKPKEDEIKQKNPSAVAQQILTPKEKPPMKIIQRNKISVAKNFQTVTQPKPNEEQKKEQTQKQVQKLKEQVQPQKSSNGGKIKTQNQPNPFMKFRAKDESVQQIAQQNEKKRFMKNYLGHEKKDQANETVPQKVETMSIQQDKEPKNANTQKQEKVKFNVITRASLLKKKQAQAAETKQPQKQETLPVAQPIVQAQPTKTQNTQPDNKIQALEPTETKQLSPKISEQQKPQQTSGQPIKETQSEPKTKFIPSIDIRKASKNHLNDCDFLSEDSDSNEDKKQGQINETPSKQEGQNDQSIEEEIDGQEIGEAQAKDQPDKEYLIDDNINADKPAKVQHKNIKPQKVPEIDQDEEIQKFCYTLLDDESGPKYQTIKSHTKNTQKTDELPSSLNNTPSFKLDTSGQFAAKNPQLQNEKKKQEEDQMKKLSSLLFKTSIKRTNIFSSQNQQRQETREQNPSPKGSQKQLKNQSQSPQTDQVKETVKTEVQISRQEESVGQSPKQQVSPNPANKKSRDWHGSSSDQSSEENEAITDQNLNSKNQQPSQQVVSTKQQGLKKVQQQPLANQSTIQPDSPKHQIKQNQQPSTVTQTQQKPFEKQAPKEQPSQKDQKLPPKQIRKNPFFQSNNSLSQKTPKIGISDSNIFKNPSEKIFNQTIPSATNQVGNIFSNPNPLNPFSSLKKNNLPAPIPLPNIFSAPPSNVIGGSNTNMFKKFLSQRQHKKMQEQKKQQENKQAKQKSEANKPQAKVEEKVIHKPETRQKQRKQSQKMVIPTSALPQIQQMISKYEQSTIHLLQEQQKTIIKSLEQIPHNHNPYNKNNSLLLPQEIKQEIIKQSKQSVKKWLSTKMLDKIEVSFRQIMQQHKKVYQQALKFYQNEARKKITTMQLQYQQQSSILMDIQNVSANMCAALQSSILQGEELHTYQLKEWRRQIEQAEATMINPLNDRIDDTRSYFDNRNKNLQNMTNELREIKEILKEKLRKKQQLKELKLKKKQQKQLKLKQKIQEQAKLQMLKMKQETKKQSKKRKNIDQNQGHVSFYTQAPQKHIQPQFYPRQPYPYY